MADGVVLNAGSGGVTAVTDDCGAAGHAQVVKLAIATDGSATLIPADATAGLSVNVTDSATRDNGIVDIGAALPAGTNNIGDVDVLTVVTTTNKTATGSLTATGSVTINPVNGCGSATLQITGTWVATVQFEATTDGTNFFSINGIVPTTGARATSTTANGQWVLPVAGYEQVRARVSAFTSGTVVIDLEASSGSQAVLLAAPVDAVQSGTWNITNVSGTVSLPTGASTLAEQQTQTTALQLIDNIVKNEDDASANLDAGAVVLAKRSDTPAATSGTDGDYEPLQVTGGRLAVQATGSGSFTVAQATATNLNCVETNSASISSNTGLMVTSLSVLDDWDNTASDGASVTGDVAHDGVDAGEPVKIGAFAETAPSGRTPVADGDRTNLIAGADGVLLVRPYCALEDIVSAVDTDTAGDSTAAISAPGVGIRLYITSVIVKNTHATTDAYVDIRDGAAGSVLATIPAPAAGGAVVQFPVPLRLTANTACAVDPSAAVTTIITTVVGFKAAV